MKRLERKLRYLLFVILNPLLVAAGKCHLPFTQKKCTGKDAYDMLSLISPGAVLLSEESGELTDILIPGVYKHAAIYIGKDDYCRPRVIEAVGPVVRDVDLFTFVCSKDRVLVLEPVLQKKHLKSLRKHVVDYAYCKVDMPYDYKLSLSKSRFYCSKLVWFAYDAACKKIGIPKLFNPDFILGIRTIEPIDILENKNFKIVYNSEVGLK